MSRGRWTIWALALWLISGLILAFFGRSIVDALWIAAGFVVIIFVFAGLVLWIATGIYAAVARNALAGLAFVGFIVGGIGLYFAEPHVVAYGNKAIVRYRFESNRATYDRLVSEVSQSLPAQTYNENSGVHYVVDPGPPVRIAFQQPGGFLDNWEGIVYDPSGEVLKAKGWAEPGTKFTAPPEVVGLFGGSIVSCSHIEGDYYRCWFT